MNFIKRAILSVWNRKGNTILLIIVFTVISTLIFGSLAIGSAGMREIKNIKDTVDTSVTVRVKENYDGYNPYGFTWMKTPKSEMARVSGNRFVKKTEYFCREDVTFVGIKPVGTNEDAESYRDRKRAAKAESGFTQMSDAELLGSTDTSLDTFFTAGGYRIVKGRNITKYDKNKKNILVERNLALKNHLDIGEKITVMTAELPIKKYIKEKFMIVGIFRAPPITTKHFGTYSNNPANYMFTSYTETLRLDKELFGKYGGICWTTFYLDGPEHINQFEKYVSGHLNMKKYEMITNKNWYKLIAGPLMNMERMTDLITEATIAAGCLIICLVLLIVVLGKRRETGVLLALGEKKEKIAGQLFFETLIPAGIAFIIAIVIGMGISVKIGNFLLAGSIKKEMPQYKSGITEQLKKEGDSTDGRSLWEELYTRSSTLVQPKNEVKIKLTLSDTLELAGVEITLIILSVGISSVVILRQRPHRLLNRKG